MKWAGLIIFVGFLSLGASMILQLLVSWLLWSCNPPLPSLSLDANS